ncbi:MAG: RNA 3'-terminal phosphate cyclase [Opitutaceae bacterium]
MNTKLLHIDGSLGEGGGQVLRTSLALSLITQTPIRIENIRAKRKKPGLMRQHLTAVQAAAKIGNASVEGATIKSQELTFIPGKIVGGDYRFSIGTAGSTLLVLQTILPPLMFADAPSVVEIEGGTHNSMAPSFDYVDRVFLPLLKRMGCAVDLRLERAGFFPAGGGAIRAEIFPVSKLTPIDILERGEVVEQRAFATLCNLPNEIAERELILISEKLELSSEAMSIEHHDDAFGAGNVLSIECRSEHVSELFVAFGEKGLAAEDVARKALKAVQRYLKADAPIGDYLADQLLLPMALARGGRFRTTSLSKHFKTNQHIIQKFLDVKITTTREDRLCWLVEIH